MGYRMFVFMTVVVVVQGGHVIEHIVQLLQVTVFGVPDDRALGLLGELIQFNGTEEWLHLGYNVVYLIALYVLIIPLWRITPGVLPVGRVLDLSCRERVDRELPHGRARRHHPQRDRQRWLSVPGHRRPRAQRQRHRPALLLQRDCLCGDRSRLRLRAARPQTADRSPGSPRCSRTSGALSLAHGRIRLAGETHAGVRDVSLSVPRKLFCVRLAMPQPVAARWTCANPAHGVSLDAKPGGDYRCFSLPPPSRQPLPAGAGVKAPQPSPRWAVRRRPRPPGPQRSERRETNRLAKQSAWPNDAERSLQVSGAAP